MITMTEKAMAKLKEISISEDIGHNSVRIKVVGGGCAGFTNDLFFDDMPSELDEVIILNDITILIDQLSLSYHENTEIDYVDGDFESGFKFLNPDVKSNCGCGSSFNI